MVVPTWCGESNDERDLNPCPEDSGERGLLKPILSYRTHLETLIRFTLGWFGLDGTSYAHTQRLCFLPVALPQLPFPDHMPQEPLWKRPSGLAFLTCSFDRDMAGP